MKSNIIKFGTHQETNAHVDTELVVTRRRLKIKTNQRPIDHNLVAYLHVNQKQEMFRKSFCHKKTHYSRVYCAKTCVTNKSPVLKSNQKSFTFLNFVSSWLTHVIDGLVGVVEVGTMAGPRNSKLLTMRTAMLDDVDDDYVDDVDNDDGDA